MALLAYGRWRSKHERTREGSRRVERRRFKRDLVGGRVLWKGKDAFDSRVSTLHLRRMLSEKYSGKRCQSLLDTTASENFTRSPRRPTPSDPTLSQNQPSSAIQIIRAEPEIAVPSSPSCAPARAPARPYVGGELSRCGAVVEEGTESSVRTS